MDSYYGLFLLRKKIVKKATVKRITIPVEIMDICIDLSSFISNF